MSHAFCRLLLSNAEKDMTARDRARKINLRIESSVRIARCTTYFIRIDDHRDPGTGTGIPYSGQPGHFRTGVYEVEGCCAYEAKFNALCAHERRFNPDEVDNDNA